MQGPGTRADTLRHKIQLVGEAVHASALYPSWELQEQSAQPSPGHLGARTPRQPDQQSRLIDQGYYLKNCTSFTLSFL